MRFQNRIGLGSTFSGSRVLGLASTCPRRCSSPIVAQLCFIAELLTSGSPQFALTYHHPSSSSEIKLKAALNSTNFQATIAQGHFLLASSQELARFRFLALDKISFVTFDPNNPRAIDDFVAASTRQDLHNWIALNRSRINESSRIAEDSPALFFFVTTKLSTQQILVALQSVADNPMLANKTRHSHVSNSRRR